MGGVGGNGASFLYSSVGVMGDRIGDFGDLGIMSVRVGVRLLGVRLAEGGEGGVGVRRVRDADWKSGEWVLIGLSGSE